MSLMDNLRDEAPRLKLEQRGDGAYGVVVRLEIGRNSYHPDGYPVVVLRLLDGRVIAIHAVWINLSRQINDLHLRVGDEFAVVYEGERQSGERTYKAFRAENRRPL